MSTTKNTRAQINEEDAIDFSEEIIKVESELRKTHQPKPEQLFNYAYYLVHSRDIQQVEKGISILSDLLLNDPSNREYLYFLALNQYKRCEYSEARKHVSKLLEIQPENRQAQQLSNLIHEELKKEGLQGLAITAGAVATLGVIGAIGIIALTRRK